MDYSEELDILSFVCSCELVDVKVVVMVVVVVVLVVVSHVLSGLRILSTTRTIGQDNRRIESIVNRISSNFYLVYR